MVFAEVSAKEGSSREEGRRGFPWEPESPAAPALNCELAIWEGTLLLRGICYAQPLDAALAAFRNVLEEWGREAATGEEVCRHSGMR